jgi:mannose-6-phosphate isomerase-like protein (cupin superfamily)
MSQLNTRQVSYREIVESISPDSTEPGAPVLPEIARSGGGYATVTKSRIMITDSRNRMAVISSPGGSPGDPHLHDDFNEWWVVYGGEMRYQIGEYEPFKAHFGDIVVAPCGYRHDPRAWKGDMCMRMVIGKPNSNHDLKGLEPARTIPLEDHWEPPNRIFTPLDYMIDRHGLGSDWQETVILDERNRVEMFHVLPGGPMATLSGDAEAWWVVLRGKVNFDLSGETVNAGQGDVVYSRDGEFSSVEIDGDESAIFIEVVEP